MEFESLGIIDLILKALKNEGYLVPTPIQVQTIPLLLGGKDVVGIAQTGTGKTAAFVIPILQGLYKEFSGVKASTPKALVLAPTRELASQISESFKSYGRFLNFKQLVVFGGVSIGPQIRSLSQGIDILIATPGRLLDLMNQGKVSLGSVKFLVLDEADRMLDMGFSKDVYKIVSSIPKSRVSSFFSATMSREVSSLTDRFLKSPVSVEVSPQATPIELIEQCVFFVDQENKCELLLDLITQHKMSRVLVFVGAKFRANRIAMFLRRNGIVSEPIHSNKSQYQRTKALSDFKSGKVHVLVATDIASRGIDVDDISHVINYDLPNEPESYVHRIGRTARAGSAGVAYSFCSAVDRSFLSQIEKLTRTKIEHADHKYHSDKAKDAKGVDARPKPRVQNPRRGGNRGRDYNAKFSHRGRGNRGSSGLRSFSGGPRKSSRSGSKRPNSKKSNSTKSKNDWKNR